MLEKNARGLGRREVWPNQCGLSQERIVSGSNSAWNTMGEWTRSPFDDESTWTNGSWEWRTHARNLIAENWQLDRSQVFSGTLKWPHLGKYHKKERKENNFNFLDTPGCECKVKYTRKGQGIWLWVREIEVLGSGFERPLHFNAGGCRRMGMGA